MALSPDPGNASPGAYTAGLSGVAGATAAAASPSSQSSGLTGALPVVGSVVSSIINASETAHQNDVNRDFANAQLATQENYNTQMWNMQNAYNSPAAQMGRYRDAGLNPNLVYGQANYSAQALPIQQAHYEGQAPHVEDFGQSAAAGIAAHNQTLQTAANVDNLSANSTNLLMQAFLAGINASKAPSEIANTQADTALKGSQSVASQAQAIVDAAQTDNLQANTRRTNTLLAPDVANVNADTYAKTIAAKLGVTDIAVKRATLQPTLKLMAASILKTYAESALTDQQRVNAQYGIDILKNDALGGQLENAIKANNIVFHSAEWFNSFQRYWNALGLGQVLTGAAAGAGAAGVSQFMKNRNTTPLKGSFVQPAPSKLNPSMGDFKDEYVPN